MVCMPSTCRTCPTWPRSGTWSGPPPDAPWRSQPRGEGQSRAGRLGGRYSLAWLLDLLIPNAPVDASGKMIDLPDREDLADQVRVRRTRRGPAAGQEELPLKTA